MKKYLTIALLLLMVSGFAQKNQTTINLDAVPEFKLPQSDFNNIYKFNPITINVLLEYVKECALDTIKTTKFMDEFIIDHRSYREMISETQLNKEGYFYDFRWLISTDPFEFQYYFIKKPTLKGFAEWLLFKEIYPKSTTINCDSLATQITNDLNKVKWREEEYWLHKQKKDIQELKSMIK